MNTAPRKHRMSYPFAVLAQILPSHLIVPRLSFLSLLPVFILVCCPSAQSASAYFSDALGKRHIRIAAGDSATVVLNVVDVRNLAGFEATIEVSGPARCAGRSAAGAWFAGSHRYDDAFSDASRCIALLLGPTETSGSGKLAVFTLHADGDGVAALNVVPDRFLLGDTLGERIPCDAPSTMYITIGDGLGEGGLDLPGTGGLSAIETLGGREGGGDCPLIYGDVNRDGTVDILDYIKVRNNLNKTAPYGDDLDAYQCDVNMDGKVNILDLLFVRNQTGRQDPIPLVAAYGQDTAETVDAEPAPVFPVEAEADGQTIVDFGIKAWRTDELAWSRDCPTCPDCCEFSFTEGVASLVYNHELDWNNPETHNVTVSASAGVCGRAMMVSFSDENSFISVVEEENGTVYSPAGVALQVTAQLAAVCPPGGTFCWGPEQIVQPPRDQSSASLFAPEAGEYAVYVSYTAGDVTRTHNFTFVAFEVRYTHAVRPDQSETTSTDIFTTPGSVGEPATVQLHAEICPPVPGGVTWGSWQAQQAPPPAEGYIEFGYTDPYSFEMTSDGAVGFLAIGGYTDGFDIECSVTATTDYGTARMHADAKPHVLVPTVGLEIAGLRWWDDDRVPCSGHDQAGTIYFGAPSAVEVRALVSTMRPYAPVTWQWELTEGAAELEALYADARLVLNQSTTLGLAASVAVDDVPVGTFTIAAEAWRIEPPADRFYIGAAPGEQCYLNVRVPGAHAPPNLAVNTWLGASSTVTVEGGEVIFGAQNIYTGLPCDIPYPCSIVTSRTTDGLQDDLLYGAYPARLETETVLYRLRVVRESPVVFVSVVPVPDDPSSWVNCNYTFTADWGAEREMTVFPKPDPPDDLPLEYSWGVADDATGDFHCTLFDPQCTGPTNSVLMPQQVDTACTDRINSFTVDVSAGVAGQSYDSSPAGMAIEFEVDYRSDMMDFPYAEDAEEFPDYFYGALDDEMSTWVDLPYPSAMPPGGEDCVYWWPGGDAHFTGGDYCGTGVICEGHIEGLICSYRDFWHSGPPWVSWYEYPAHYTVVTFDVQVENDAAGIIGRNDDDDDGDGVIDCDDTDGVPGEDDLVAIHVTFAPSLGFLRDCGVRLEVDNNAPERIRLWAARDKSVPYSGDTEQEQGVPSHLATRVFVEGISPSLSQNDASFTIRLIKGQEVTVEEIEVTVFGFDVAIDDPEVEGEYFRACDYSLFGTVAPTVRISFSPPIAEVQQNLTATVDDADDETNDVREITQYLTFDGAEATGTVPAPEEEDNFGYYVGRSRTTVVIQLDGREFRKTAVSFHYIIGDENLPGSETQFIQHVDVLSCLEDSGDNRVVRDLVIAQFEPETTDERISEILRDRKLLVAGLEREYQIVVVKAGPDQDQQEISDYLAAQPEVPYTLIPGVYDYDPETGYYDYFEGAGFEGEVNLENFVNEPPVPVDPMANAIIYQTPVFYVYQPGDDACVAGGDESDSNFGQEPGLDVDSGEEPDTDRRLSYLRFDLQDATKLMGTVELHVVLITTNSDTIQLYGIEDDNWDEDTITFANAPNLNPDGSLDPDGLQLITDIELPENDNVPLVIDATSFVHAQYQSDKVVSFLIYSETGPTAQIASKEFAGCEPFLYFDPEPLPEDAGLLTGRRFTSIDQEVIDAVFSEYHRKWFDVQVMQDEGYIEYRQDDEGNIVEFIDWENVPEDKALNAADQTQLFLSTSIGFNFDPAISQFLQEQARLALGLAEYTDAGDVTVNLLQGDFEGLCYAVAGVAIPGMTGKAVKLSSEALQNAIKKYGRRAIGKVTGLTKNAAEKVGRIGMRKVLRKFNFKRLEVLVDGTKRRWNPSKWGFDGLYTKGDNFVVTKIDHNLILSPEDFSIIVAEAKGGTGRCRGYWRTAVTGEKRFMRQMGADGEWIRAVIGDMKKSKEIVDVKAAEALEKALKQNRVKGLIISTPIKNKVIQESKIAQVIFQ